MPYVIIPEGGGQPPTTQAAAAYAAAKVVSGGDQTAQEQQAVQEFETTFTQIAQGWQDSGGTGGRQIDVALEVADFAGRLEAARNASINQHAAKAAGGTLQARHAQSEMHGADTAYIVEMYRLLLEIRERLNDSPY